MLYELTNKTTSQSDACLRYSLSVHYVCRLLFGSIMSMLYNYLYCMFYWRYPECSYTKSLIIVIFFVLNTEYGSNENFIWIQCGYLVRN